jgi:hypothetical protein
MKIMLLQQKRLMRKRKYCKTCKTSKTSKERVDEIAALPSVARNDDIIG